MLNLHRRIRYWWRGLGFAIYDKDHRIIIELAWYRVQFWSFFAVRELDHVRTTRIEGGYLDTDFYVWRVGFNPMWREVQPKKKRCLKCKRFVPSPCETKEHPDGYYESGPWDGSCHEVYNPGMYH